MAARRFCCEQDVFQFSSNDVFSHRYRVWLIAACLISLVNYLFVNVVFLSYGWFMAFIPFLLAPIVHTILMAGIRLGRKHYILPYFIFQVFYILTLSFCCIAALWTLLLPRWACDDDDDNNDLTTTTITSITSVASVALSTITTPGAGNVSTETSMTSEAATISHNKKDFGMNRANTTTPAPCNEGAIRVFAAILMLFFLSLIALNTFLLQAFVKFYVLLKDAEVNVARAHYHVRRPPTSGDPEMEAPPVFASPLSEKQFYGQAPPSAYHISVAGLYDMQQGGMPPPPFIPEETPIGTVVHPPSYNDATTVQSTPSASISTTGAYAAPPSVSSSSSYVAPPGQWDTFDDVSLTSASQLRSEAPPSVHRTEALPVILENDLIQLETGTGTLVHQHPPSNFNDVM